MKNLYLPNINLTFWHIITFFIIVCYHNIYIFTEESILLFCFFAWLNITWNYISPQVNSSFKERNTKIHQNFQGTARKNIETWKNYRQGYLLKTVHVNVLNDVVPYVTNLIKTVFSLESKIKTFQFIAPYLKRLNIVKDLEKKFTKIPYTTIYQNIYNTATTRNFYTNQLQVKSFHSESKLDTLERIRRLQNSS
uniref:Ymf39 n=1 Tax=Wildemania schizophylla TaxID=1134705 RepID=A0A068EYW4_WILSC|nr:ymf39 [Wildemania schizophylla]AID57258.1 ymf39 [Wildemania schizophylla]